MNRKIRTSCLDIPGFNLGKAGYWLLMLMFFCLMIWSIADYFKRPIVYLTSSNIGFEAKMVELPDGTILKTKEDMEPWLKGRYVAKYVR